MASADELSDAREDARLALYKAITEQVNDVAEGMGPQAAASALKELAEAFAWATATAQSH
ncbi:hypothetical protein ACFWVT_05560 [Streptomyces cyaneofuscatus]|uniref:hypothetical protein n=1 Tax=Streptomyces cyaneofuscatus TaxID=66883 RepID=UPI00364EDA80